MTGWYLFGVACGIVIGAIWVSYAVALELHDVMIEAELRQMLAGE